MTRFARRDASGFAFDVHEAADENEARKRLGLPEGTEFFEVPAGTEPGAALTVEDGRVTGALNPAKPQPDPTAAEVAAIKAELSQIDAKLDRNGEDLWTALKSLGATIPQQKLDLMTKKSDLRARLAELGG